MCQCRHTKIEENERSEDPDRAADHSSASHRCGSINLRSAMSNYTMHSYFAYEQDDGCGRDIVAYGRSHLDERLAPSVLPVLKMNADVAINMTPGAI